MCSALAAGLTNEYIRSKMPSPQILMDNRIRFFMYRTTVCNIYSRGRQARPPFTADEAVGSEQVLQMRGYLHRRFEQTVAH